MILTLPFPPSKNRLRRAGAAKTGKPFQYRSATYKSWLEAAGHSLNRQQLTPLSGPFYATMTFVRPDQRHRDIQNLPEGVFDLLESHKLIDNDSECQGLECRWVEAEKADFECQVILVPCERRG